jgi:uncharacterized protein (TIGR03067 family)
MYRFLTALLLWSLPILVVPAAALTPAGGQTEEKELKAFQGRWQATAFIIGGNPVAGDQLEQTTLVVKGKKLTLQSKKSKIEGEFNLDPSKSPKSIDATVTTADGVKLELRGIYQWNGSQRRSCFALPNYERPGDFLQKQGYVILEWKKK